MALQQISWCTLKKSLIYHIRMHVFLEVCSAEFSVPVISNVTSVHNLSKQIPNNYIKYRNYYKCSVFTSLKSNYYDGTY